MHKMGQAARFDGLFDRRSLDVLGNEHFIEQHLDDITRGHLWIYSPIPFPKKIADANLGLATPCIHKNGYRIEITGLQEPLTWSRGEAFKMLFHMDRICKKYGIHRIISTLRYFIHRLPPLQRNTVYMINPRIIYLN
jgi:hypothetical protein